MSNTKFALRTIVLALAGSVLVFLLVGQLLADHWQVSTERTIAAPAARVAPLLTDLNRWLDWSAVDFQLGPPTRRSVIGEPGVAGQRAVWQGPIGSATVELTAIEAGRVAYVIRYEYADNGGSFGGALTGALTWAADAAGERTRIGWLERGELSTLMQRWSNWFGALQEKVRQVQGASLAGLEEELLRSSESDRAK